MTFDLSFWLQLLVVFAAVAVGGRLGGVGLGAAGGFGVAVLVFVFGLEPSGIPVNVMLIIAAVIAATSLLEAAGGLDLFVRWAEKLLRKKPSAITFVGPVVCSFFTILVGTSYVAFALYPVVAEIAASARVRPERAVAASVVCAGTALYASPMSASMAAMVAVMCTLDVAFWQILSITIPSFFFATFCTSLFLFRKGAELADDPEFQRRVATGEYKDLGEVHTKTRAQTSPMALRAVLIFFAGILLTILVGSVPGWRPSWEVAGKTVNLAVPQLIEMMMLATGLVLILCCRIPSDKFASGAIFRSGLIGVVGIFGIAWCTGTFLNAHTALLADSVAHIVRDAPYLFCFAAFLVSSIVFSSTVATTIMLPLGVKFGLSPEFLVGTWACCFGNFTIPGAAQIACTALDRTGTTKLGSWVLNHSYMLPGLVWILSASAAGYALSKVFI